MNKQQREIQIAYGVRFGQARIHKKIGRGGKEISRSWSVFKDGAANELAGSVRLQKIGDRVDGEPGFHPSKWVQGDTPRVGTWVHGPRFDELWQAVEWCL